MEHYLAHHGIKGQKWGIRRTPEQLGHKKVKFKKSNGQSYSKDDVVFISGKVSYDKPITDILKNEINKMINTQTKIIIGDAPGADTRVQEYLNSKKYKNVEVYTTDKYVRNNVGKWKVKKISSNGFTEERLIRRQKDIAMTNAASKGLAISSEDDRPDSATSLNIVRLNDSKKPIVLYDFKQNDLKEAY